MCNQSLYDDSTTPQPARSSQPRQSARHPHKRHLEPWPDKLRGDDGHTCPPSHSMPSLGARRRLRAPFRAIRPPKFGSMVVIACGSTVFLSFAKALSVYPCGCGRTFPEEPQMRRVLLSTALVLLACGSPTVPRSASTPSPGGTSGEAVTRAETRAALAVAAPRSGATSGAAASTQVDATGDAATPTCTFSGAGSSPGPTQITSQAATDDT